MVCLYHARPGYKPNSAKYSDELTCLGKLAHPGGWDRWEVPMAPPPMYQQIAEELRRQIESGELEPGQQLPTELELRETHDASRNTVRDAIKRLISLGLVVTKPGQGTFVTRKIDPFVTVLTQEAETGLGGGEGATYLSQVARDKRIPKVSGLKVEIQTAPAEIRKRLGLFEGDQVVLRHEE